MLQVGVLPREGLQWKARSTARTCNGKPDPKGHAQKKARSEEIEKMKYDGR